MMSPLQTVTVRQARLEDLDVLVRFSAAMAQESEGRRLDLGRLRAGTARVFNDPQRGRYLVAEVLGTPAERETIVGQLLITYEWSDWRNAMFWWIQSVYVDPAWRRRGVYRRMHETVVQEAHASTDVCGIRLYVERENKIAQATYAHVGLKRSAYEVYEEDFVFTKSHGR